MTQKEYKDKWRKTFRLKHPKYEAKLQAKRRAINRAWLFNLKTKPCVDCGKCFHPCAMDFDHVRDNKATDVSRLMDRNRKVILDEIAKCDLVCANCHRLRTYIRTKQYLAGGQ